MSKLAVPSPSDLSSIIIYGIASSLGDDVEVSVVENVSHTTTLFTFPPFSQNKISKKESCNSR